MKLGWPFFFFFILFFTHERVKSQTLLPLQFKSGNVFPVVYLNDFDNPQQRSKMQYGNQYYFILQFEKVPNEYLMQEISTSYDLVFEQYLPSNSFYCYSTKPISASSFERYRIRSISAVETTNKIDLELKSKISSQEVPPGNLLNMAITVYEQGDLGKAINILSLLGFEVQKQSLYKKIIHLKAEAKELPILAALPFIVWIEAEQPTPFSYNLPGLNDHRDNVLNFSGLGGYNLHGDSVVIGEGDDGYVQPHLDYSSRLSNFYLLQNSDHPEHVAGTIIGAGNIDPSFKGMADKATLLVDHFNAIQDDVPILYPSKNMVITSNSWGSTSGCSSIGQYTASSSSIDQQLRLYPKLLHVFAASNDGANACAPYSAGYRTISSNENCAKNILTVGAVTSIDAIASFSSRGPCLDGRIKPEVCAVGVLVNSTVRTNTYSLKSGTSMATPGVSATLALLEQRYRQLHSFTNADGAFLKALLANTADDLGNAGPDYYYGFGRINARKAIACLDANRYLENTASQNDSISYVITIPSDVSQLKVMLYWNDKEGSVAASYALVNNLDLKVYDPASTLYQPWVLDYRAANCALPATRKADTLNNIEQVTITNPSSGSYLLVVRGTNIPFGPQNFKLIYDYYPPAIKLTYPIGNEKLVSGTSETIYWDNTGITTGTFSLSYSSDSGITYTSIASGIPVTTHFFTWSLLPSVYSNKCMVKITHSTGLFLDSSMAIFTIAGKPGSFSISACDKQARLSWTSVTGALAYQIYLIDTNQTGNILSVKQVSGTSCSVSPLTSGRDYWFSVAAVFTGGFIGQRTVAVKTTSTTNACNNANDIGISAIVAPTSGRRNTSTQLSSTQNITVTLINYSGSSVSSIPIHYSLNGGTVISETYGGTISANSSVNFTFATTANFLATGNYLLTCFTTYVSDPNASNDTIVMVVKQIINDPITLPLFENMEGCTQTSLSANYIGVEGMELADYSTSTLLGRSRFSLSSGFTTSGSKSVVMDKSIPSGATNINYVTFTFNLSNYTASFYNPTLTFNFTHYGEELNAADSVWIRGDDTQPFIPIYSLFQNKPSIGFFKTSSLLNIKTLLSAGGQSISSSFQLRFGQQDDSSTFSSSNADGFAFDDIRIFDLNSDVGMDSVIGLNNDCSLSAATRIIFKITNNSSSVLTNIPVAYTVNGGSVLRDTIPTLAANTTVIDTFSTLADFSLPGLYQVRVWNEWVADQYHNNDTFIRSDLYNYGLVASYPYHQNFETSDGNWISGIKSGTQNSWLWGSPSKTMINGAGSGSKCWVTNLTSNYPSNEESFLLSPCLDFSALSNPKISFLMNFVTESTWDCVVLEQSINGGVTWQRVDSSNNTELYNAPMMQVGSPDAPVWSNSSSGWSLYQFPLHGMEIQSNCKIRFRFFSDGGVVDEGVAIDSIVIYDKLPIRTTSADYLITGNKPIFKGSEWIDVADDANNIVFSINPKGNNLGSTAWGVRINNGSIRTDSVESGGTKNFGYYLDRNFFIHPQTQPSSAVDIRFYVKTAEIQRIIDSVFNKYGRVIPADSIDVSKEASTSINLDPTIHTGSTGMLLLNSSASAYNTDLYLQVSTASFSKFNPSYVPPNPSLSLPVKWLTVKAQWEDNLAKISWKVGQEINVGRYEIEVSWDGLHFEKVGEAASKHQSYIEQNYFFFHSWVTNNQTAFYRIKQIDFNGTFTYSALVRLSRLLQSSIYPIPATDKLNIILSENHSTQPLVVTCFDMEGRALFSEAIPPYQRQSRLNVKTLPNGIYMLRFNDASYKTIRFEVFR